LIDQIAKDFGIEMSILLLYHDADLAIKTVTATPQLQS